MRVFSDSELVVRQIGGAYRVKHPDMVPLHRRGRRPAAPLRGGRLAHVRREQNKEADRLANRALDEKASKLD